MKNKEQKYIPFHDKDEMLVHLHTSQLLIESLTSNLQSLEYSNPESYEELRQSVINSCTVLRDGFNAMALSIEEGEVF